MDPRLKPAGDGRDGRAPIQIDRKRSRAPRIRPRFRSSLSRLFEIPQIGRRLILAGRHQHSVAAQIVVFASDHDLPVIFIADEFWPLGGLQIGIADISFVDGPRPRQGIVDYRDFVMKNIAVFLVDEDAFLEDRAVVAVQWNAGDVVDPVSLEAPRLHFEHIELAVAILVDPLPDRIALDRRIDLRGPVAAVGEDAAQSVVIGDQYVGRTWRYHKFQRPERDHHERHAGTTAHDVFGAVAKSAALLIFDAGVEDGLIFGRQWRPLSVS